MHAEATLGAHRPGAARSRAKSSAAKPVKLARVVLWSYQSALIALIYYGWINRAERHWTPEHGLGYWLGIAGVVALALLLVYPLRKRIRALRFVGGVPFWFRLHMALGMAAPTLILLHCNFKSASTNASVALFAMLIVAASGFIGRYLYAHIYSHLNGSRTEAAAFFEEAHDEMAALGDGGTPARLAPEAFESLTRLTERAIAPQRSLATAVVHRLSIARQSRRVARDFGDELRIAVSQGLGARVPTRRERRRQIRIFEQQIDAYCRAIRRAASLAIYERLFALWHILHLPLFVMLVVAVVVHIVAVHLY